jgi:Fe-S oxidoreductase/FAD/FMN-containing dehydrogenase
MNKLNKNYRDYLKNKFDGRVNFNRTERKLYGHDIATVPAMVKPFIGNNIPDAVVQPVSEQELAELSRWASDNKIPLTPRGKATSGYGGVLPVKKGIVVDFHRMDGVIKIDKDALTVTVQPGIIWERLDRKLKKHSLTLKTYPSSYPGSTAGGWLAHGGSGIGSYEAGEFSKNVVSTKVVLTDGTIREFSGEEIDLVADTEGITGLISELTIKIMPLEDMKVTSIAFDNAADLQKFSELLIEEKVPIWSLLFINPKMAELKNVAPLREHGGHPVEKRIILPEKYIVTLTYRAGDEKTVSDGLAGILKKSNGSSLGDDIAEHEWQNRFKLMVVKRLGPSLVPAEVIVPLDNLGNALSEIENKIRQPLVKEGVVIREGRNGKPEVVLLGFIPSDQRKFSYNFVFALTLSIIKIAEKYGGRPYATGMYFAARADKVLGTDRLRRLKLLKKEVDPDGVMNPGKVIKSGPIGTFLGIASFFEPMIRPFGNKIVSEIGERPPAKDIKGIPADVVWYAYACSQCGYCVPECDQFYGRGWESQSPRGRWYWLREYIEGREKWDQYMVDSFIACTTCELCNLRCSANLPIEPSWLKMRGELIDREKRMTIPPFEMMAAALRKEGDIWAGYRKDRTEWFPEDLKVKHGPGKKSKSVYFAGCTASYVENDIGMASVRLLDEAGVDFTYLGEKENCCGTPMLVSGKWDVFEETIRKNIEAVKESGADTVISSCPACDMMWRHVYPQWAEKLGIEYKIEAKHYSEVVAEKIRSKEFSFPEGNGNGKSTKVTWHDSCHIGRVSQVYDEPREIIRAIPDVDFVEMDNIREEAHCCGSVLTLIKDPPVAADVGKTRLDEAIEAGAEKVIALCPCCEFQFRVTVDKKKLPIEITDLANFACQALGYDFPDPNPEVQKQWAVFEGMIALMSPKGFAELMGTMWPELIDAMPFKMGKMMRAMGKIPGMLKLMKPMFPVLFPILLPKMMPKVMPTMLERISEIIPMPDYMQEQMPEMMPKIMDNLMPHMIRDVVPLVSQPMIDYLSNKNLKTTGLEI